MLLHRVRPDLYRTNIDIAVLGDFKEFKEEETPGFAISVLTAMMPVILIAIATICSFILPESNPVNEAIQVVGAPDAAMLLSLLFAIWSMGVARKKTVPEISTSMTDPAPTASTINAGLTEDIASMGATSPAAVRDATVAEPRQTRNTAATSQAAISGDMLRLANSEDT